MSNETETEPTPLPVNALLVAAHALGTAFDEPGQADERLATHEVEFIQRVEQALEANGWRPPMTAPEPVVLTDGEREAWRTDRSPGWFRDIGYALQNVVERHHYEIKCKGNKPDDPGWHECSCGTWQGYWSGFEPHVADMLRALLADRLAADRAAHEALTGGDVSIRPNTQHYYDRTTLAAAVADAKTTISEWDYDEDPHGYCHQRPILVRLVEAADRLAALAATAPTPPQDAATPGSMPTDPVPFTGGWRDRHGDVWHYRSPDDRGAADADRIMVTPETAPFSRAHVERKWGPLIAVSEFDPRPPVAPPQEEEPARKCPACGQPAEIPGEGRYCGSCQDYEGHCADDHCMTCGAST